MVMGWGMHRGFQVGYHGYDGAFKIAYEKFGWGYA
jgi:hypothetical protein